jgi:23S rRNA (guanosine2251-2'-O)-methyltransferase
MRQVYGLHALRMLLHKSAHDVQVLRVQRGELHKGLKALVALAEERQVTVEQVPRATLDEMTAGAKHQGAVALCRKAAAPALKDWNSLYARDERNTLFLVLDGVEDPHNLGACLRVADAAGVRAVIRPVHRGVGLTPAAVKVASGAAESVPLLEVNNLARTLSEMKQAGIWLMGADAKATKSIYEVDLTGPLALVLGGEGEGMRRLTRESCDHLVHIPMRGSVESLNVAVSAGICLYEALRQRKMT